MSTHSNQLGPQTAFCRHPAEWYKSRELSWALVQHPEGGYDKVAAVAEVLAHEASYARVAARAEVSIAEVKRWEADLEALVRRAFWRGYERYREEAQRIKTHPFLAYYGE